jgi:hypothetical protein
MPAARAHLRDARRLQATRQLDDERDRAQLDRDDAHFRGRRPAPRSTTLAARRAGSVVALLAAADERKREHQRSVLRGTHQPQPRRGVVDHVEHRVLWPTAPTPPIGGPKGATPASPGRQSCRE